MRFAMPHYPCEFVIPDDWLEGLPLRAALPGRGYQPAGTATLVPLADIQPPRRNHTAPLDWQGMARDRFVRVLERMVVGDELDPVPLLPVTPMDGCQQLYPFVVYDGLHRFYASIVAGFDHLTADIRRPF